MSEAATTQGAPSATTGTGEVAAARALLARLGALDCTERLAQDAPPVSAARKARLAEILRS